MINFCLLYLLVLFVACFSGCSDSKNLDVSKDSNEQKIESKDSNHSDVKGFSFESRDRTVEKILVDYEKPIETYPRISSRESKTDQSGVVYRDGLNEPFTGRVVDHFPDGKIKHESTYLNGQHHGLQVKYFENGNRSFEATFDNGTLSGITSRWWPNGLKRQEDFWSEGKFYGRKLWDATGRLVREERITSPNP